MITGVWKHADGERLAIQLDEDALFVIDCRTDPSTITDVTELEGDGWAEQDEAHDACIPVEQA